MEFSRGFVAVDVAIQPRFRVFRVDLALKTFGGLSGFDLWRAVPY